jgi:hypothetical protein
MNFRFDINIKLELGLCETAISYLFFVCKIVSDYRQEFKSGPCLKSPHRLYLVHIHALMTLFCIKISLMYLHMLNPHYSHSDTFHEPGQRTP